MTPKAFLTTILGLGLMATPISCTPLSGGSSSGDSSPHSSQASPDSAQAVSTESFTVAANALVLGDISDKPVRIIERFQPLADYLADQLEEHGISEGRVKVAPDLPTMTRWIANGEVDLYFDSPYPALSVVEEIGAVPLLRRWKKGVAQYHSIFFTLAESDIQTIEDLNGQLVGLDSPYSTSGFMLPIVTLLEAGLEPMEKEAIDEDVDQEKIGYIFTRDDSNTILWVLEGDVAAGVVDSETFSRLVDEELRQNIRILLETESVPRHIAIAAPDLDPTVLATLKTTMMAMDESADGRDVLETFERTVQFDEYPNDQGLKRLQELFDRANDFQ